jgi:hypothetical protein
MKSQVEVLSQKWKSQFETRFKILQLLCHPSRQTNERLRVANQDENFDKTIEMLMRNGIGRQKTHRQCIFGKGKYEGPDVALFLCAPNKISRYRYT